jgi:L-amino acid N-acyltransferase YncA
LGVRDSTGPLVMMLEQREEGSPSMSIEGYPKEATLKDERVVTIRPLTHADFDKLRAFFEALPEEDRLFMRHDVTDPEVVAQWVGQIDFDRVIPLVAEESDKIVANSTLHLATHGWATHVGHIRLATARTHRHVGLGTLIAREMVLLAEKRNLEKLQSQVIEDNVGSVRLFENLGFKVVAVLKDLVKDQKGKKRNLAIMIADVADIERILDDWIQDSMIPAFRVPDDGVE